MEKVSDLGISVSLRNPAVNDLVKEVQVHRHTAKDIQTCEHPPAWNGNMDIQLCLDFFAVITYISDYYSKDDSGTMQLLIDALKDAENEDLRAKCKRIKSVFLTH